MSWKFKLQMWGFPYNAFGPLFLVTKVECENFQKLGISSYNEMKKSPNTIIN
jgi:hypothetical protein